MGREPGESGARDCSTQVGSVRLTERFIRSGPARRSRALCARARGRRVPCTRRSRTCQSGDARTLGGRGRNRYHAPGDRARPRPVRPGARPTERGSPAREGRTRAPATRADMTYGGAGGDPRHGARPRRRDRGGGVTGDRHAAVRVPAGAGERDGHPRRLALRCWTSGNLVGRMSDAAGNGNWRSSPPGVGPNAMQGAGAGIASWAPSVWSVAGSP